MVGLHSFEVWRVVPLHTPRVLRHCSRCGRTRQYVSSDKFRLNAQQQKIDIWLIYRCSECDSTWNCRIITRSTTKQIGAARYLRFQQNDIDLVWSCAFDCRLLSSAGVQVDGDVHVRVERAAIDGVEHTQEEKRIRLELTHERLIRLDRLIAGELQVSQSLVHRWHQSGGLFIQPEERHALRRPARNGQLIVLRVYE